MRSTGVPPFCFCARTGGKEKAAFLPPWVIDCNFLLVTDVACRNQPPIHFNEQRAIAIRQIHDDVLGA